MLRQKKWIGLIVFLLIAVVGLYLVKWAPYYEKAIRAMTEHSIGPPIISGKSATVPAPSWNAALSYSLDYFQAIWQAMIVGIVLGSLIQVLIPRDGLVRWLGGGTFKSTMVGGLCGMPSMMCTCCAAPVVIGMRKSQSSVGAAIAYWTSNTALNPAVLVFMAFILPWKFVVLRVLLGWILVFGVSHQLNRLAPERAVEMEKIIPPVSGRDAVATLIFSSLVEAIERIDLHYPSYLCDYGLDPGGSAGLVVSHDQPGLGQ